MGEDDPALIEEIGKHKLSLEAKHEALLQELQDALERVGQPDRSQRGRKLGRRAQRYATRWSTC